MKDISYVNNQIIVNMYTGCLHNLVYKFQNIIIVRIQTRKKGCLNPTGGIISCLLFIVVKTCELHVLKNVVE